MTQTGQSYRADWSCVPLILIAIFCILMLIAGCGPNYQQLRHEGQDAMLRGEYGPARYLLMNAENTSHRKVETLHDLGVCSVMVAKSKFEERNHAAAFRELDNAVAYYRRAIDERPGHQASLEGLNIALELKGQFEEALKHAQWTVQFVGPSAKQYIFLAEELEQRGDADGALLRYRQAVAMEPENAKPYVAMAKFLRRHNNDAADQYLAQAQQLDPKDPWVQQQLGASRQPPRVATRGGP
jgi:tetratricopeptide (TPR) repeat protein